MFILIRKRPSISECLQHSWLSEDDEPPSPSPLMLKIPEPTFPPTRHHSDAGHRHGPPNSLGVPSRGPRSCQICRKKLTERNRYLSKSREAIIEKATQSNLKKSLSKSRERLCDMRLTLSKSRDHLNAENIYPKKLSKSQEKFCNIRNLSKSQEVLSASLTHAKRGTRGGAVSDMNHAQHMVSRIMNDSDNTLDLVLVPGGHVLMSHPDLLRTNSGSLQMLPITESGRSTPGSICSISTVHDIQCANHGMYLNPPDGSMIHGIGTNGQGGSSMNPPAVVIATPTASEPPTIEPILEHSEEEELETKSNASDEQDEGSNRLRNKIPHKKMSSEMPEISSMKRLNKLKSDNKENKKVSNKNNSDLPSSKEEKESKNYEKKQSMSRSASVDADIGRAGLAKNANKTTKSTINDRSENTGSSNSVNSKETASIGIQVNLMKSSSSPNLVRKPNVNEKLIETMEIDIEQEIIQKCPNIYEKKEQKISSTINKDSPAPRKTSCISSNSKERKESTGAFSHDSTLGDGDTEEKPNYSWREDLAKFQSQKPLRVSKLIGTFDKSGNEVPVYQTVNDTQNDLTALKRRRRGSLQIQLNEGILKDLANVGEEARKKEAKEKEQRRKSTSSILMRNIENMKIQDKITDILDHGRKGVIEEKALEKTDVSEKLEDGSKPDPQNSQETKPSKRDANISQRNNNHSSIHKTNSIERSNSQEKQKLNNNNKDKQKSADANLMKRTSSPYLDRKLQQQSVKGGHKQKNWEYFEINHPKAISDKKLQELKAKYARRRTEGTLVLERDKKSAADLVEEKRTGNADTKTVKKYFYISPILS